MTKTTTLDMNRDNKFTHYPFFNIGIVILFTLLSIFILSTAFGEEVNLDAISHLESSNNPQAVNGNAIGLFQITPVCLRDYLAIANHTSSYKDASKRLLEPNFNRKVAQWYLNERIPQLLRAFGKPVTLCNQLICFNAGIKYVAKDLSLPKETKDYLEKYFIYIERLDKS